MSGEMKRVIRHVSGVPGGVGSPALLLRIARMVFVLLASSAGDSGTATLVTVSRRLGHCFRRLSILM